MTLQTVRLFAGTAVAVICFMAMVQLVGPSDGVTMLAVVLSSGFVGAVVAVIMRTEDE